MVIKTAKQFSGNPDLTLVFTSCIKNEVRGRLLMKNKQSGGKRSGEKNYSLALQDSRLSLFCVYSSERSFYNEVVGYVRNQFFFAKENETFSLYEQGKFSEVRYVVLPVRAGGNEDDRDQTQGKDTSKKVVSGGDLPVDGYEFLDKVRHIGAHLSGEEGRPRMWEVDLSGIGKAVSRFDLSENDFISSFVEGLFLGVYYFSYQEKNEQPPEQHLKFVGSGLDEKGLRLAIEEGHAIAAATKVARDLANAAPNDLQLPKFVKQAGTLAKKNRLKFQRIRYDKLVKDGLGGLLAVNKGSKHKAELLLLEYGSAQAPRTVFLVGKGVLFDSGGMSIKPAAGMVEMKMDMSGAAIVLAVMSILDRMKITSRVVAAIPVTDNMINETSMCVGDVITMFNGKSVEVLNTDAEGRLVLGDALSYGIKKYKPDYTIDLATLTGACMVALGHHCAGLWSNDDDLAYSLMSAGDETHERLWRMPLYEEYLQDMKSPLADLKNVSSSSGSANTAAKFLEQFVAGKKWAHLDIAGVMSYHQNSGYKKKGASGFGVRLLLRFLQRLI